MKRRVPPLRSSWRRRGVLSMELVLVLPLVLILFFGIVEFSLLLHAQGEVIQASRAGARFASLSGTDAALVTDEVLQTLGGRFGDAVDVQSRLGEFPGEEVVVAVRVPMSAASPDLLWPVGYSLRGRYLIGETRMLKE